MAFDARIHIQLSASKDHCDVFGNVSAGCTVCKGCSGREEARMAILRHGGVTALSYSIGKVCSRDKFELRGPVRGSHMQHTDGRDGRVMAVCFVRLIIADGGSAVVEYLC